jgi:SNF family Na+-dependent transporter
MRLEATADFFSIGLLARNLFAPFRQIAAGRARGPLDVQLRAFFDRLISRCIGMLVRLFMMLFGMAAIFLNGVIGGISLMLWILMPVLPLLGLVLFLTGWVPWSN